MYGEDDLVAVRVVVMFRPDALERAHGEGPLVPNPKEAT